MHEHLGRTEIARHAQITPQAVTNIVGELLDEGLLVQLGRLRSGRGQPPIQFAVNPDGPLTAGVEIAADHMVTALIDLAGGVRAQSVLPLDTTGPDSIPARVADEVRRLEAGVGTAKNKLLGIGVVMPGPFAIEGMSSVGPTTLPGWTDLDPAALFTKATGERVVVGNDATAAAVGERLYGAGRQLNSFCYLYFGVGLGLGIIQDGRPLRGAFGNAGEIGHIGLVPRQTHTSQNPTSLGHARAGPPGALEHFASVLALRKCLEQAGRSATGVEDIQKLHEGSDPDLLGWIAMAADYLAPAVAMLENIFDPETVIFGGGLPDCVLEAIIAALAPLPISVATRRQRSVPRVMRGQTGQLTAALGAAALPLLDTVTPHLSVSDPTIGVPNF